MSQQDILHILQQVKSGGAGARPGHDQAQAGALPGPGVLPRWTTTGSCARALREVIYGAGKTPEHICAIASAMRQRGQKTILVTRIDSAAAAEIVKVHPLDYNQAGHIGVIGSMPEPDGDGENSHSYRRHQRHPRGGGGGGDRHGPGNKVTKLYDVGVSGVHRLLHNLEPIMNAPLHNRRGRHGGRSALGDRRPGRRPGYRPVPTSVGYGASLGGIAALPEHAQHLRQRRVGGEHRQRLRRRLSGQHHQPSESEAMTLKEFFLLNPRAALAFSGGRRLRLPAVGRL